MRLTGRATTRSWQIFWAAFVGSFALLLLWSLATPLLGSPDEPSHIIRAAAVVRGDLTGTVGKGATFSRVQVPEYIAALNSEVCFAFRPTTTADCPKPHIPDPDKLVSGVTTSTLNTPVYYFFTGLPSLVTNGPVTIYLMRAVSSLMCALMLSITAATLAQLGRSKFAFTALLVSMTPMLLFLGGSVNPNGVEVCAAMAVLSCLLALGRWLGTSRKIHVQQLSMLAVSVFFLVNTRSLAFAWLLFAVIVAIMFSRRDAIRRLFSDRITWIYFGVISVAVFAAAGWYLAPKGLVQDSTVAAGTDVAPFRAFELMVIHTSDYAAGWVGTFGWLDIAAPTITFAIWTLFSGTIIVAAIARAGWTRQVALLGLLAAIVLLPAIAQAALITNWGWVWQGRYHFALFAMLLIASGVALDKSRGIWTPNNWVPSITGIVVVGTVIGHLAAFVIVLRRYAVGTNVPPAFMLTNPQWQPPLGLVGLSIAFSLALFVFGWFAWRTINRTFDAPCQFTPGDLEGADDRGTSQEGVDARGIDLSEAF